MSRRRYLPSYRERIVIEPELVELPPLEVVNKELAERYLVHYIRQAWYIVEPKNPYIHNWHIDAIAEHLEAVSRREIQELLINMPPRHMKSLCVAVFWPTWNWLHDPAARWLYSSYAEALSKRDSLKCRRLITSDWYQSRWSDRFQITSDQNEKLRFENDKTGYRIATSVGGVGTGEGGDNIVVDDPHNVKEGESDAKRQAVLLWWDESMSTRLDDPKKGAKVIVMQRVHEGDLSGHVLEKELGYTHLCLPARFEEDRKKLLTKTPLDFEDPRTEEGEVLHEERYDNKALKKLEVELGIYGTAGQLQQRPSPRGGGMFEVGNFVLIEEIPNRKIIAACRYWDKAGTEGGGANSAGVLMLKFDDGTFCVADCVAGKWAAPKREKRIKSSAILDGTDVEVGLEQEPGSGGKESAENTVRNLAGYTVYVDRVTGSKEARAEPYSIQVEAGNVYLLNRAWTKEFVEVHEHFPMGKIKDHVDAAAGAFNRLVKPKRKVGVW